MILNLIESLFKHLNHTLFIKNVYIYIYIELQIIKVGKTINTITIIKYIMILDI